MNSSRKLRLDARNVNIVYGALAVCNAQNLLIVVGEGWLGPLR